jgi:hypothetical protein
MELKVSPNIAAIRGVVRRIEAQQKKWNQEVWAGVTEGKEDAFVEKVPKTLIEEWGSFAHLISDKLLPEGICGTNFCFAGHAVLEAGDAILIDPDDLFYADTCMDRDGELHSIEGRAQKLLGLDDTQAKRLFDGNTGGGDWERYKEIVTEMTGVELD